MELKSYSQQSLINNGVKNNNNNTLGYMEDTKYYLIPNQKEKYYWDSLIWTSVNKFINENEMK